MGEIQESLKRADLEQLHPAVAYFQAPGSTKLAHTEDQERMTCLIEWSQPSPPLCLCPPEATIRSPPPPFEPSALSHSSSAASAVPRT